MVKAYEIAHRAMRFTCRFGGMLGIALGVIVTAAHADDAPFVKLAPVTAVPIRARFLWQGCCTGYR